MKRTTRARTRRKGDFSAFLADLAARPEYRGELVTLRTLRSRKAFYEELSVPLSVPLANALKEMGIPRLYSHQSEAIEGIRAGENVVVVTSTASGKTLCYNLPVLETLLAEPKATALYLFPTKALAQDQARGLVRWAESVPGLAETMRMGVYDGDTPGDTRRKLREEGNLILSNPDMLHQGILPNSSRWARFFERLRYVVVDEIHTYRGVFGSHVALVLRRLRRICRHYGSNPQFICCSATIANPGELAAWITGLHVSVVDNDGSPKGPKHFAFWNPPFIDEARMERLSANVQAERMLVDLVERQVQTIAFAKARVVAELLYRYARERLSDRAPALAKSIRPYRAGYLPQERREIERQLFSGQLLGVTATNALELGIDVGGLDACLIVGYPGTIASTWQQAGRAGRGTDEALVVMLAYNDPIDQYLMRHPDYFFGRSPENAVIDPQNIFILASHLRCAAYELPLEETDVEIFGPLLPSLLKVLGEEGDLLNRRGKWFYMGTDFPAQHVSLRTMSRDTYTIVHLGKDNQVIGHVDAISAPELVYPQAVYLHEGETYLVRDLDTNGKVAYVEPAKVDYYTQAIVEGNIRIRSQESEKPIPEGQAFFGAVAVTWQTVMFKKIKFYQLDSIGYGKVDLPPQHLDTEALWLVPSGEALNRVREVGRNPTEGLEGIRNVAIHVLPLFAMCDKQDIGGKVDSSNTGSPTVFIYDRYPDGLGFARKGYEMLPDLLTACLELIDECECAEGCPSCVGIPTLRPAQHMDPDVWGGFPIPDKEAAKVLLHDLLALPAYTPSAPSRERTQEPSPTCDWVERSADPALEAEIRRKMQRRRERQQQ